MRLAQATKLLAGAASLSALAFLGFAAVAADLEIVLNQDAGSTHFNSFELHGIAPLDIISIQQYSAQDKARAAALFAIYTAPEEGVNADTPPLLGAYQIEYDLIRFTPSFALLAGSCFSARINFEALDALAEVEARPDNSSAFTLCTEPAVQVMTNVTAIYPTSDYLPENLLRFYVYFSTPMGSREPMRHIKLLDSSGQEIAGVFFVNYFDLWSPDQKRLTVLFDPGRVKSGLRAHEDLGRALEAGKHYSLLIEAGITDQYGRPIERDIVKKFTIIPEILTVPDKADWNIEIPRSGTKNPLSIAFPSPMDHALLDHYIFVSGPNGSIITGEFRQSKAETQWSFVPDALWQKGKYQIHVNRRLEDVAGNNLYGLFDLPPSVEEIDPGVLVEFINIVIRD